MNCRVSGNSNFCQRHTNMYYESIGKLLKLEKTSEPSDFSLKISELGYQIVKDKNSVGNLFNCCNNHDVDFKIDANFSIFVENRDVMLRTLIDAFENYYETNPETMPGFVRNMVVYERELNEPQDDKSSYFDRWCQYGVFDPPKIIIPKNITLCYVDGADNDIVNDINQITDPTIFKYLKISRLHFNKIKIALELLSINRKITLYATNDKFIPFYVNFCKQRSKKNLCIFSMEPIFTVLEPDSKK